MLKSKQLKKQIPHQLNTLSEIRVALIEPPSTSDLSGLPNQSQDYAFVGHYPTAKHAITEISMLLEADEAIRTVVLIKNAPPPQRVINLTPHETRILKLLVEGSSFKSTAQVLGVSINTVSFHVRRIYEKLEVHSKSEAVAKAIRNNLV